MIRVQAFTFNPYQENTYILIDELSKDCIIIDPGMHIAPEEKAFSEFIAGNELKPTLLLNTHCHIDHVLGNRYVYDNWGLEPQFHEYEVPLLIAVENYAPQMGIRYETSPIPKRFLQADERIPFGENELQAIFAPGHSPGHLCFYSAKDKILIGGDVLFRNSIGRTDLPGGDYQTLENSIRESIYVLPEDTTVYPGHGPATNIGFEKKTNPFVKE